MSTFLEVVKIVSLFAGGGAAMMFILTFAGQAPGKLVVIFLVSAVALLSTGGIIYSWQQSDEKNDLVDRGCLEIPKELLDIRLNDEVYYLNDGDVFTVCRIK